MSISVPRAARKKVLLSDANSPYQQSCHERLQKIAEKEQSRVMENRARYIKGLLTPEDINNWFFEGNSIVVNYLPKYSLYIFTLDNPLRKICISWMLNVWFDRLILFSICLNSVFLAADSPLNHDNHEMFLIAELVFNSIFLLEFAIKLVAQGGFDQLSGYFRDPWNRLDFSVLLAGWLPIIFKILGFNDVSNFSFVRSVRMLKVLKTVHSVPDLKRLVQAILDALPRLVSVGYLLGFIFLLFGILGTQLFSGALRSRCFPQNITTWESYDPSDELCGTNALPGTSHCPVDAPKCSKYYPGTDHPNPNSNPYQHFDNTPVGFLTIFVVISLEGWSSVMYNIVETSGLAVVAYFVILVILGSFFVINLIIAVVYQSYIETIDDLLVKDSQNKAKLRNIYENHNRRSMSFDETPQERAMHAAIAAAAFTDLTQEDGSGERQPLTEILARYKFWPRAAASFLLGHPRYLRVRRLCQAIVSSSAFHASLVTVILFNICILAVDSNGVEGKVANFTYVANAVCTIIFSVELLLQIVAQNIPTFFASGFNVLDAIIVIISIAEMSYRNSSSSLSAFRTLRVLRTFKLLKRWDSLQHLIYAVFQSGPGLGYFCLILFLYLFVCSLMGFSLFAGKLDEQDDVFGSRSRFDTLFYSFITTFQLVTGENWDSILYRTMNYSPWMGAFFCLFVYVTGSLVVLNILLAILLENFSEKKGGEVSYYERLENEEEFHRIIYNKILKFCSAVAARCWAPHAAAKKTRQVAPSGRRALVRRLSSAFFDSHAKLDSIPSFSERGPWEGWDDNSRTSNPKGKKFIENTDDYGLMIMKEIPVGNYFRSKSSSSSMANEMFSGCFKSCELVDILLDKGIARSTMEAVKMGQELVYRRKIIPLEFGNEVPESPLPSDKKRAKKQMSIGQKYNSMVSVQFKDDHSLYRTNFQETQVTEWLLQSSHSKKKMELLREEEKRHEISLLLKGVSFGLFSPKNKFRIACARLVSDAYFEALVMCMILISSICLAMDEPGVSDSSTLGITLHAFDIAFTVFFSVEMLLKMTASGVCFTENAYMSNGWNALDFFIVMGSVVSLFVTSTNLSYLKAFRALRALRPLRMVSRVKGLKAVVNACILVVKPLLNFTMVVSVFIFTFAILGASIFRDKLSFCKAVMLDHEKNYSTGFDSNEFRYTLDKNQCEGMTVNSDGQSVLLEWGPVNSNFDTIGNSFLTLFELSSMENWPEIMYPAMDVPSRPDSHPVLDNSKYYALFFVAFIIVGSFFISNLFVGIIVHKFNVARTQEKKSVFLTDDQQVWFDNLISAMTTKPHKLNPAPLESEYCGLKRKVYFLTVSDNFKLMMDLMIVLNVCVMSIAHFDQDSAYTESIRISDIFFCVVFAIEIMLRYFATTPRVFFSIGWNVFDLVIVIGAVIDVVFDKIVFNVTILRVLRIGRVLRLLKNSKNIVILINTLYFSLPSLVNVGTLLFLAFFVFAVVGMNLFGKSTPDGDFFNDYQNFSGFCPTMLLLFCCLTGENWNSGMYILKNQGYPSAVPYFALFLLVNKYMMLNLFIAVILENFENALTNDMDQIHQQHLLGFSICWASICNELQAPDPDSLPCYVLVKLLHELPKPLGFKDDVASFQLDSFSYRNFVLQFVRSLDLKEDSKGRIHFLDTLSALIRRHQKQHCLTKNVIDPSKMPEKQRHKLLYEMRRNCKKTTLRNIEQNMKDEKFTEIDLIVELNCAQYIQKNWRLARAARKFVDIIRQLKDREAAQALKGPTGSSVRSRFSRAVQALSRPKKRSPGDQSVRSVLEKFLSRGRSRGAVGPEPRETRETVSVEGKAVSASIVRKLTQKRGSAVMPRQDKDCLSSGSGETVDPPEAPEKPTCKQDSIRREEAPHEGQENQEVCLLLPLIPAAPGVNQNMGPRMNSGWTETSSSSVCSESGVERQACERAPKPSESVAQLPSADCGQQEKQDSVRRNRAIDLCVNVLREQMKPSAHSTNSQKEKEKPCVDLKRHLGTLRDRKCQLEDEIFHRKLDAINAKILIRQWKYEFRESRGRPPSSRDDFLPMKNHHHVYQNAVRERRQLTQQIESVKREIANVEFRIYMSNFDITDEVL